MSRGGVEDTRLEAKAKNTKKKSEAKAKDNLFEDRHCRGQGQECSRPRPRTKDTSTSALKKKKRSSQKFFKRSPRKNVFQKIFQALHKILTIQKIVLSSSRGQANFRGLEASRPRPRTSKCVLEAKDVIEDSTSGYVMGTLCSLVFLLYHIPDRLQIYRTESLMLDAITYWGIGYTELTLSLWNASACVVETVI